MKQKTEQRPVRVGLISLGCAKNLNDAEIMLGSLLRDGAEITNDAAAADVVIVNTCSFIDAAQEESVDAILQSSALREARHPHQGLIVSGCLPQRFRDELPKLLPEVDAFMGIDQVSQVNEIVREALAHRQERLKTGSGATNGHRPNKLSPLTPALSPGGGEGATAIAETAAVSPAPPAVHVHQRPRFVPDFETPRFRLTPKHFAYVKIAEGCNHPCSFCIIPRMRGSHRSRAQSDIVREARQLVAEGVRELNLISQDSTYYGLDLRANHRRNIAAPDQFKAAARSLPADATTLGTLLRELNDLPGDFWIRLLYTHPAHWTDALIETIADCPKVARYVDMPLQHIHHNMLERMRRETSQEYIVDLIRRIRAGIPGIALRTTFIVGFPGETESSFRTLIDFIGETRFERLGVFTYSQEQGTRAAAMQGQVPDRLKKKRRDLAMAAQREVAEAVSASFIGRRLRVLVEHEATPAELRKAQVKSWEHGLIRAADKSAQALRGRFQVARGEADAPDIDGRVYVRGALPAGQFAAVRVTGHTTYDLIAEPA